MAFKGLQPILYGGREVYPLVEGGKGVSATNHASSGAWAAAGGIGTVSAVNADSYDAEGKIVPQVYDALTRVERHHQLIRYAVDGAVEQVRRAYDIAGGRGAININVLWEQGGAQAVLEGTLERTRGLVTGVTCGAGMPYKLAEIAERFNVHYLPIVSSSRAFRALWKRSYHKVAHLLGAVVYEDPWLAGGHNGLSNAEDPLKPEDPYPRVAALRATMRAEGVSESVPIVMRRIEPGDVLLHKFSPTGFYSSAVKNPFLIDLIQRSERQIPYSKVAAGEHTVQLDVGVRGKNFWVTPLDYQRAQVWFGQGYTEALKTPDDTIIYVTPQSRDHIRKDQKDCMGCLSHCQFSSWKDHDDYTTGRLADPRSFCIQKTLQDIAHGEPIDENLMFAGHAAYRFKTDPFYSNNFTPTVKQLVDRILTGD
jgi:NAD(P)H-dependent flavin oxidoreductase YrpB (nitropropane dioxygenase family)